MLYLDYSRKPGQWIPNAFGGRENLDAIYFLKRFNEVCYERFPGIMTIAEESTAWPGVSRPTYLGGLGFGFKWNMGWMHDFLRIHGARSDLPAVSSRQHHFLAALRVSGAFHSGAQPRRSGARQTFAAYPKCRATNGRSSPISGCFTRGCTGIPARSCSSWAANSVNGANGTTTRASTGNSLDLPRHDGLRRLVQHLNYIYKSEPALWELDDAYEGFEWIDFHDADNSVVAFMRKSREGDIVVFVVNATPVVRYDYRLGVPGAGFYREIINTDAETYGGSNVGNFGGVQARIVPWMGREHSILIHLPPLATVAFKLAR